MYGTVVEFARHERRFDGFPHEKRHKVARSGCGKGHKKENYLLKPNKNLVSVIKTLRAGKRIDNS